MNFNKHDWIIAGLAITYLLVLGSFSVIQHRGLKSQMNDLGNMDQAVWKASRGDLSMPASNILGNISISRLAIHTNFIFWLIAPLYWLWADPELLLWIGTLACTMAGLGLYAFSKRHFRNSGWVLLPPIAFWLSPMVQDANLYDFHAVTLATAFFIWMFWSFDTGRVRTGWILLVLALLCEEKISFLIFMYGLYEVIVHPSRRRGVLIMLVAVCYLFLALHVLVPLFNQGRGFIGPSHRYPWDGKRFFEILGGPGNIFRTALISCGRPDRLRIPFYFILSGGISLFWSWPMFLLLLPSILEGILSDVNWIARLTGTYYWIIPAAVINLAVIVASKKGGKNGLRIKPGHLVYFGCITLFFSILFSPLPYGIYSTWENFSLPPERHTLKEIISMIPNNAKVCAQNNLGSHMAHRDYILTYGGSLGYAEYAVFHLRFVLGPNSGISAKFPVLFQKPVADLVQDVKNMILSPEWGLIACKEGYYLFQKNQPSRFDLKFSLRKWEEDSNLLISEDSASTSRWAQLTFFLNQSYGWHQIWQFFYKGG